MHYIYQTLPSPRAILKAIRAGIGFGSGTETSIIYTGFIYCSNVWQHVLTEFNTAFGSCGYFNLPIVRFKRKLILKHTLCTCILVLGLTL